MKKLLGSLLCFIVLGFSSSAFAYSYSFDIQSGGLWLDVAENCEEISLNTTNQFVDDLVIDVDFDLPPDDMVLNYTASIAINLNLFNFLNFPLNMSDIHLGSFDSIDPSEFLGDGTSTQTYLGSQRIDAQFGEYTLTDALFEYDMVVTPDEQAESNRYTISINNLSLSEGNVSEMLWGILNDLDESGTVPEQIDITPPFYLFGSVSGSLDIQADPVPVPGSLWILGAGILGLAGLRRKQR